MKKVLGVILSLVLLLSLGSVAVAGGEETTSGPVIQKPIHVTIVDELGNPVTGATVQVVGEDGSEVAAAQSMDGVVSLFLEKGTYTLKIIDAPEEYLLTGETTTVTVTLEEAEEKDDIRAETIASTNPDHKMFCKHEPSHLETYRVHDGEGQVTGYCFNQNYDPPALDEEDCTYKRLVGSPELLYELAQSKLQGVTAQELYDHVLSMIYHRDDIKAKYGFDDLLTDYLVNMAIKNFTDGDIDSFKTTDEDGKNLVVREYYPNGPVILDENGHYQFRPGGSVLGSIVGHANSASSGNPDYVFPQAVKDAWHELITLTDHPADYYLYIYYPDNFMTKEEGIASGWTVPSHYANLYYADAYQCLMSPFEVEPLRATLTLRQATDIEITKEWDDADDQDGIRPDAEEYTAMVHLLAGGQDVTADYADNRTVTDNGDGTYTVSFTGLPKLDEEKAEIAYTIREDDVTGYKADKTEVADGETITNTHEPETTDIEVIKEWDDGDDADGMRPTQVTVRLLADDEVIDEATVTAEGKWRHTFTGLPVYKNGDKIVYTVTEEPVAEYETAVDGFTITNRHQPETTQIDIEKIWDDGDDHDGLRPESITVNLLADGEIVQTVTVKPDTDGNWAYRFTDLVKSKKGVEIVYTVTEEPVPEYETTVDGYTITNKHEPEMVEISVQKVWIDENNGNKTRPNSITIHLLADGKEIETVKITPDDKGDWSYRFAELPAYRDGKRIVYTITEDSVKGYVTSIDGFRVTNTYTPATGDVFSLGGWIAALAVSALGIAALLALGRRRRTDER